MKNKIETLFDSPDNVEDDEDTEVGVDEDQELAEDKLSEGWDERVSYLESNRDTIQSRQTFFSNYRRLHRAMNYGEILAAVKDLARAVEQGDVEVEKHLRERLFASVIFTAVGAGYKAAAERGNDWTCNADDVAQHVLAEIWCAVQRFEPVVGINPANGREGTPFIAYINQTAKNEALKYCNTHAASVTVPRGAAERIPALLDAVDQVGSITDIEELVQAANEAAAERSVKGLSIRRPYTSAEVVNLLGSLDGGISCDAEVVGDDGGSYPLIEPADPTDLETATHERLYQGRLRAHILSACHTEEERTVTVMRLDDPDLTDLQIGAELGLSSGQVKYVRSTITERLRQMPNPLCDDAGELEGTPALAKESKMARPRITTSEHAEVIASAYENGQSIAQISTVHNLKQSTVRNILLRQGVKMRRRGRRMAKEAA